MSAGCCLYLLVYEVCGWWRVDPAGRRRRETVRIQAAELFEQNIKPPDVARRLRVSLKSAYLWHQMWRDGGREALASRGPSGSRCRFGQGCGT